MAEGVNETVMKSNAWNRQIRKKTEEWQGKKKQSYESKEERLSHDTFILMTSPGLISS